MKELKKQLKPLRPDGKFASEWFRGLREPNEIQEREEYLRNCTVILGLLREILERRFTEASSISVKQYDNPNWALHTAHNNGRLDELDYIYKLITPST